MAFAAGYDNETAALAAQLSHVMFPTISLQALPFLSWDFAVFG